MKKTLSWIFLGINAVLFLPSLGFGLLMMPILPLFLAGMSTDSGDTTYVIPTIIIGYMIVFAWYYALFKSIQLVTRKGKDH